MRDPGGHRRPGVLNSDETIWSFAAVASCPAPTTCVVQDSLCVTDRSCYGHCLSPEARAEEEAVSKDPEDPVRLPFVTVLGQGGILQREGSLLPGVGGQAAVHLDVSRYVLPYVEGLATFTDGGSFAATGGLVIGWRTFVNASLVGLEVKEGRTTTVTKKTYVYWDSARYPLVVGAQVGGGVWGLLPGQTDRGRLSEKLAPRIEVGPSVVGQHHVNALFTFDPISGVVGLRGNAWMRLPLDFFWLTTGISYDVAFNPPETGGYDFVVTGVLGGGFSLGERNRSP